MQDGWVWRSLWAALGAALAVSIGGGGIFLASAAPGPAESTVVAVTPARALDTRDSVNLGLPGPFASPLSQKLQITGVVPVAGGGTANVVPAGATGVLLNVTAVGPSAAGFVSIRPGDATGSPSTSSLNVEAGANVPNAVQVALPLAGANAGRIDITYDAYGNAGQTTDLLIDVVGYMTNTGLQQLVADLATRARTADIAALPASHIIAAGRVSSGGTKSPSSSPALGTWSVSRTAVGEYSLMIPGGCLSPTDGYALLQLSLGIGESVGEIGNGGGNCVANVATFLVTTSNSAGTPMDKNWMFTAIRTSSALSVADVDE